MGTGRDIYNIMKILEDYTALSNISNERNVYKIEYKGDICCYKTKAVQETKLLRSLGGSEYLPKILDYNLEEGWLIKEWCPGTTLDNYVHWKDPHFWNAEKIRELYQFTKSLFDYLHPRNLVLQDFKSCNISYGDKFMYFDLDWVVDAKTQFKYLLGSEKYAFKSFESLYSTPLASTNDDYFSFANIIYDSLLSYPSWSNKHSDPMLAYNTFEDEYDKLSIMLLDTLTNLNLTESETSFIIDCFNPIKSGRPQVFDWTSYQSSS
jgi:serine/threonine protein kinase